MLADFELNSVAALMREGVKRAVPVGNSTVRSAYA